MHEPFVESFFMGNPRVSIVLPVFNGSMYVADAIRSALNQIETRWELIVVDDGSTDNTAMIVNSIKDARIHYTYQPNQGLSAACNTGIRLASGEFIGLLAADDLWLPDFLTSMMPVLSRNEEVGAVYCGCLYIDTEGNRLPQTNVRTVGPDRLLEELAFGNFLTASGVLVRRQCYERVGLFDESLRACEDWDMWLRILRLYPMVGVPRALICYRVHGNNMSANLDRMDVAHKAVLTKHFGLAQGDPETWPLARQQAYSGYYLTSALRCLQYNLIERCRSLLRQALIIRPELSHNLDLFYELGLGNQPLGMRGVSDRLDLARNAAFVFETLDSIFKSADTPTALKSRSSDARGYAGLALGLLAYSARKFSAARFYFRMALRAYPPIVLHRHFLPALLKTYLGVQTVAVLRQLRSRFGP